MSDSDGHVPRAGSRRPPYAGAAVGLAGLWDAAYSSMESLLETVTLADIVDGRVPSPSP